MAVTDEEIEAETQALGKRLWSQLNHRKPNVFDRRWWDDRILSWAMEDESVKIQMFRFVDVLPMLKDHKQVTRHLHEYFVEVKEHLPAAARLALPLASPNFVLSRAVAWSARSNARRMASRFIAGSNVDEVLQSVLKLRKQGFAFSLDLLGEAIISEAEADRYQSLYLELIRGLAPRINALPQNPQIDSDNTGPIPRVNLSLKLSALYSQFKPVDPAGTYEGVARRLRELIRAARKYDCYLHIDMEHYAYKDLTLEIFKRILMEEEFRDWPDSGIVIQAYLPDAMRDLEGLLEWVKKRGTPITVRLVKGAYWDYETVVAEANGWPVPVYTEKWQSDANFERCCRFLMENHQWLKPALGSHNLRSLSNGVALARKLGVPPGGLEIQVLYGMGEEFAHLFGDEGYRVRVYTPFGELIPGMAYLVRRLLENTSNDSFLRLSHGNAISAAELLRAPEASSAPKSSAHHEANPEDEEPTMEPFENEPPTDFSREDAREAFQEALDEVAGELGKTYPLVINNRLVESGRTLNSLNPSKKSEVIGAVCLASEKDVDDAIQAARDAFPAWSKTDANYRAEYLELAAKEMRDRRFELCAWITLECGKPWAEADGDVAEAIDFCMYYAREMRRLDSPRAADVAGEDNRYFYRPRGVCVVIAPWNFPLAILCGMTVAALVTGNTVIMKPAEQSSVVAAKLMEIFREISLPEGVVNYLPGLGEEIGPQLVESPEVDLICFTGSRAVGLEINKRAAETHSHQANVKKVIAEMGGKNAVIVDEDADLDEAVQGVVYSAFGYAGQKCSACSRAIVLAPAYDQFVERLVNATKSLKVGPATDPGTTVGPLIDDESQQRVKTAIANGNEESELAFGYDIGELADTGFFAGPHVFVDVSPDAFIAQQEIFGPVLAVMKTQSLDEAVRIANGTDYALTAGIYSRSPANLKRMTQDLQAGNIYLNRSITGAMVERQPFGGYKMSGIGSKAGGPDYLQQFMIPVNVTENTMRRGFAPTDD